MNTYIAILRGINVSGQKKILMKELVHHLESLGFTNVRTYIQSGNVIFESEQEEKLQLLIENKIKAVYSFDVPVQVHEAEYFVHVLENNPFLVNNDVDEKFLHVTFLGDAPDSQLADVLEELKFGSDEFVINEREVYLYCPNGYGKTKLTNTFFERKLKVSTTTRNWKTVTNLVALSHQ